MAALAAVVHLQVAMALEQAAKAIAAALAVGVVFGALAEAEAARQPLVAVALELPQVAAAQGPNGPHPLALTTQAVVEEMNITEPPQVAVLAAAEQVAAAMGLRTLAVAGAATEWAVLAL